MVRNEPDKPLESERVYLVVELGAVQPPLNGERTQSSYALIQLHHIGSFSKEAFSEEHQ